MVPVAGSTELSTSASLPGARRFEPCGVASTVAPCGHRLVQGRQQRLLHREGDVDRRDLVDGGEDAGGAVVGGLGDVALLDRDDADPAGDRRGHRVPAELHFEVLDRRLVGEDRRAPARFRGLGVVEIELRRRAAGDEVGVTRHVALGLFERGLVLGELGLGAVDLGPHLPRVEFDQRVAGLDRRSVGDQHLVDRRVEMRPQRHRGDRLRRADLVELPRQVFAGGVADDDDDRRPRRRCRGRRGGRSSLADPIGSSACRRMASGPAAGHKAPTATGS